MQLMTVSMHNANANQDEIFFTMNGGTLHCLKLAKAIRSTDSNGNNTATGGTIKLMYWDIWIRLSWYCYHIAGDDSYQR